MGEEKGKSLALSRCLGAEGGGIQREHERRSGETYAKGEFPVPVHRLRRWQFGVLLMGAAAPFNVTKNGCTRDLMRGGGYGAGGSEWIVMNGNFGETSKEWENNNNS